jgi:flagellar assembly protein FliH
MSERLTVQLERPVASVRVRAAASSGQPGAGKASLAPGDEALEERIRLEAEQERNSLRRVRLALEEALERFEGIQLQMLREAEEHLLDLALEIARKVLMQEIDAQRYQIDPIVREALTQAPLHREVVVRLNAEDWRRCEMARNAEDSDKAGRIRFVADPSVKPAECVLETSEGTVTSNLESHVQAIGEALKAPE